MVRVTYRTTSGASYSHEVTRDTAFIVLQRFRAAWEAGGTVLGYLAFDNASVRSDSVVAVETSG